MMKECKTKFNNVSMLSFKHTILMVCVGANQSMSDAMIRQKGSERPVLSPPPHIAWPFFFLLFGLSNT